MTFWEARCKEKRHKKFFKTNSDTAVVIALHTRFPLRLDWNFQHSTESPVLIIDQPYMTIFFTTVTQILQRFDKNRE